MFTTLTPITLTHLEVNSCLVPFGTFCFVQPFFYNLEEKATGHRCTGRHQHSVWRSVGCNVLRYTKLGSLEPENTRVYSELFCDNWNSKSCSQLLIITQHRSATVCRTAQIETEASTVWRVALAVVLCDTWSWARQNHKIITCTVEWIL